jgi:hypothetical protein
MKLELDHAPLQAFLLGQVFGELGGRLAVDSKLELVARYHNVDGIPTVLADIILGHRSLELS